ncbi:MAG TPA: hypothetical protein VFA98_15425 [Thermoanaerobaculia bacterium]|jgi:hypothetical protein|nr:hypothetical protein [Thermoanaerobaculia bacterium]
MTDYAAAPVQPILQGLVTTLGGVTNFFGRGVEKITHVVGSGLYRLVLDAGLPGNAGAVEPSPEGALLPAAPDTRTMITRRTNPNITSGPLVTYVPSSLVADGVEPPPDGSLNVVVVLFIGPPEQADADFEIITWTGVGSAPLV